MLTPRSRERIVVRGAGPADALADYECAFDSAQARADEPAAVISLCVQIGPLGRLGDRERITEVAQDALRRAELGRPGAVAHLARAARTADRLGNPQALDQALREIAIAAAEAALVRQAAILTDDSATHLLAYRSPSGHEWVGPRLERASEGEHG